MIKFPNSRTIGIVVARAGSKGLVGKNTKNFLGKPLVAWTIEQAKSAQIIDEVVVSSDDDDVLEIASELSVTAIRRPANLAQDESPIVDTLKHTVSSLRLNPIDTIVLLEPTSPLRPKGFIDECLSKYFKNVSARSAVSISALESQHPDFSVCLTNDEMVEPWAGDGLVYKRRQDLKTTYFLEGSFYCCNVGTLLETGAHYGQLTMGLVVPKWQSFEIDDLDDWILVETLGRKYLD